MSLLSTSECFAFSLGQHWSWGPMSSFASLHPALWLWFPLPLDLWGWPKAERIKLRVWVGDDSHPVSGQLSAKKGRPAKFLVSYRSTGLLPSDFSRWKSTLSFWPFPRRLSEFDKEKLWLFQAIESAWTKQLGGISKHPEYSGHTGMSIRCTRES